MLKSSLLCFALLSCTLFSFAQHKSAKRGSIGWQPLFAADLSNASFPEGVWTVENGELNASEDKAIWSDKQYKNFVLDLDFKTADAANSGVIVYCTDTANWIPHSVEIQIADDYSDEWSKAPTSWQCGAIFGHLAATKQKVVKKPGEWNHYTITCKGSLLTVVLNGQKVTTIDMRQWTSAKTNPDGSEVPAWLSTPLSELSTDGYIGLQGKYAGGPTSFRNIRIKQL